MGEDFCVPSENEFFNENERNLAGTGSTHPKNSQLQVATDYADDPDVCVIRAIRG
jgi:hypothetical protein